MRRSAVFRDTPTVRVDARRSGLDTGQDPPSVFQHAGGSAEADAVLAYSGGTNVSVLP